MREVGGEIYGKNINDVRMDDMKKQNDIVQWMRFFSAKSREEFEEISKGNEYLEEAYNELKRLSDDEIKRYQYEAREKKIRNYCD